ncbi:IPT/TIG domain-containing protein [Tenacibaculum sp. MEBiC06402]|uniref:IPT/TIG domain-containing protein n=1 Tax=unclassified Tenacibaculum TaxID=2635139 RepID=UPI003B9C0E06
MKTITNKIFTTLLILFFTCISQMTAQTVTSIKPSSSSLYGNTAVTITGSGFTSSSKITVLFGATGVVPKDITVVSDSKIIVRNPAVSKQQSVNVKVLVGSVTCKNQPSFNYELPKIKTFNPPKGSTKGNEIITIHGKYFTGASYVKFGESGSTPLKVSDTLITVKNPAHAKGSVDLSVEVQGKYGVATKKFNYQNKSARSSYVLSLENLTGLDSKYKVYVLGFSTGSKKKLIVDSKTKQGSFATISDKKGYITSYELGSDIASVKLSNLNPIDGARIYFFVKNTDKKYKDNSSKTSNGNLGFKYDTYGADVNQVGNPPQSDFPQYNYIEVTYLADQGMFLDVSSVDGFFFPVSVIAEGAAGKELGRVGQTAGVSGKEIADAYKPFMKKYSNSAAYNDLYYPVDKDLVALLNPGLYLENNTSSLETVFDTALNKLYTDASYNMNIWQKNNDGVEYYFKASPVKDIVFPGTPNKHDALEFKAPTLSEKLYLFNPVGFSVVSYYDATTKKRESIKGSIKKGVLTFDNPLPADVGLTKGMYVSNGGCVKDQTITIQHINKNAANEIVSLKLNTDIKCTSPSAQYKFSKAPTNYYYSSGHMTFAGIGLFADGPYRYSDKNIQTIVNGLENQISTALNRGVALIKPTDTGTPGRTTTGWGKETNWYPKGQPQNLFSYFMHTAKVGKQNIFALPKNAVKSAQKEYMAQAYGFAYDEDPIEITKTNQPPVPAEFSGAYPTGTTQLKLVLGPWKAKKKK